jgi:hypothetical protein
LLTFSQPKKKEFTQLLDLKKLTVQKMPIVRPSSLAGKATDRGRKEEEDEHNPRPPRACLLNLLLISLSSVRVLAMSLRCALRPSALSPEMLGHSILLLKA